jgi:hypothetical protein
MGINIPRLDKHRIEWSILYYASDFDVRKVAKLSHII